MEQSGSRVDVVLVLLQVRAGKLFTTTRDVIFYTETNSKSKMVELKIFVKYPKNVNVQ